MPAVTEYTLRRSPRARRVRVSVDGDGAVQVDAARVARLAREADEAVRELRAVDRAPPPRAGPRRRRGRAHAGHGAVPGRGARRSCPQPGRTRVHRRGDLLLVPDGDATAASSAGTAASPARRSPRGSTRRWPAPARRYTRLTIRGQRTRWASCSATGAMSFNWRLLLAPEAVLDYVVEHEVCHLEVMDHSPRFWRAARVTRARLARARALAAPLRLDARCSEAPGGAPRTGCRRPAARPRARRTRPVHASTLPSPRTSSPARTRPGPRSSARGGHLVGRLVAPEARVDGAAPLGGRRRPRVELERVERLLERRRAHALDLRAGPHGDAPGAQPAAARSGCDVLPARDLAAVLAREARVDLLAVERAGDGRGLRAAVLLRAGDVPSRSARSSPPSASPPRRTPPSRRPRRMSPRPCAPSRRRCRRDRR